MTTPQATRQTIHDRYWEIANDPEERGYVQVRALDSLSRLLDLFPRGQHPTDAQQPPEPMDPALLMASLSDEQIDALIAREEVRAKARAEARAKAEAEAKAESEQDEEDDEASNPDEDEPP